MSVWLFQLLQKCKISTHIPYCFVKKHRQVAMITDSWVRQNQTPALTNEPIRTFDTSPPRGARVPLILMAVFVDADF